MKKPCVLLVNLGSPDSTIPRTLENTFEEFLIDPRDRPTKMGKNLISKRNYPKYTPKKSAEAYQPKICGKRVLL